VELYRPLNHHSSITAILSSCAQAQNFDQPMVSVRVDRVTELGVSDSQPATELSSGNSRCSHPSRWLCRPEPRLLVTYTRLSPWFGSGLGVFIVYVRNVICCKHKKINLSLKYLKVEVLTNLLRAQGIRHLNSEKYAKVVVSVPQTSRKSVVNVSLTSSVPKSAKKIQL